MATWAERVTAVQAAIDAVLTGGQSVRFADRQWTKADLEQLRLLERDYLSRAAAEARAASGRGRITYVAPE